MTSTSGDTPQTQRLTTEAPPGNEHRHGEDRRYDERRDEPRTTELKGQVLTEHLSRKIESLLMRSALR